MLGSSLGHYRVLALLGSGAMGEVYVAEDLRLKRRVALKVLPSAFAADAERLERFRVEAESAAALSHPAVVTIHSIEEALSEAGELTRFLTMELVQGERLDRLIPEGGLPLDRFLRIATGLAAGVAAAHAGGVVHRDLKPANIIVMGDDRPKILDFGLAKLRVQAEDVAASGMPTALMTQPGRVLGTPAYMAPEQAQGGEVGPPADLFALGAVFYEMLCGRRPFPGESRDEVQAAVLSSAVHPIRERRPDVPEPLERLVQRCLEKDPKRRFRSADELLAELEHQSSRLDALPTVRQRRRVRGSLLAIAVLATAVALLAGWVALRQRRAEQVRHSLLPAVEKLLAEHRIFEAFIAASEGAALLPDDPALAELLKRSSTPLEVVTEPAGARVLYQDYLAPDSVWREFGVSPAAAPVPDMFLRFRVEMPGHETLEVGAEADEPRQTFVLVQEGRAPEAMLWVPNGRYPFGTEPVEVPGFWLDRFEVSNRDYQVFVDAGGYQTDQYWVEPIEHDGARISLAEASRAFVDSTGRPGPATWSLGRYPEGKDDDPVRGLSWYEAAAYARFAGRQLPTLYHWRSAAPWSHRGEMLLLSNFESDGPRPVGASRAVGRFGHVDLAGNVAEWCWNRTSEGERYLLGGSWPDPSYVFTNNYARAPLDRSSDLGFRLALFDEPPPAALFAEIDTFRHDFSGVAPVDDSTFAFYRSLFAYDDAPFEALTESIDESPKLWRTERVSINAAYDKERLPIYLFLPRDAPPPWQAVVFVPGSNAGMFSSIEALASTPAFFVPRSGRALVWPVYFDTLERIQPLAPGVPRSARATRDRLVRRVNDLQRTVDYLMTREDIRSDRLGYLGLSWGAEYGPVFAALDKRFRAHVFLAGGFDDTHMLSEPPEVQPWNYATRVEGPVLMINGASDYGLPVETGQKPMFEMLATPPEHKRLVVLEGGHLPYDWNSVFREALGWYDEYLGRVEVDDPQAGG